MVRKIADGKHTFFLLLAGIQYLSRILDRISCIKQEASGHYSASHFFHQVKVDKRIKRCEPPNANHLRYGSGTMVEHGCLSACTVFLQHVGLRLYHRVWLPLLRHAEKSSGQKKSVIKHTHVENHKFIDTLQSFQQ